MSHCTSHRQTNHIYNLMWCQRQHQIFSIWCPLWHLIWKTWKQTGRFDWSPLPQKSEKETRMGRPDKCIAPDSKRFLGLSKKIKYELPILLFDSLKKLRTGPKKRLSNCLLLCAVENISARKRGPIWPFKWYTEINDSLLRSDQQWIKIQKFQAQNQLSHED